jgi:hypothetical protein
VDLAARLIDHANGLEAGQQVDALPKRRGLGGQSPPSNRSNPKTERAAKHVHFLHAFVSQPKGQSRPQQLKVAKEEERTARQTAKRSTRREKRRAQKVFSWKFTQMRLHR